MKRLSVLLLCTFAFTVALRAQNPSDLLGTGNDFLRQCNEPKSSRGSNFTVAAAQYARCMGYIQGFLEGHMALAVVSGVSPTYCCPQNVDFGQVRRIVVKFLNENPDKTHLFISALVEKALIDAFPCPK